MLMNFVVTLVTAVVTDRIGLSVAPKWMIKSC